MNQNESFQGICAVSSGLNISHGQANLLAKVFLVFAATIEPAVLHKLSNGNCLSRDREIECLKFRREN